MREHGFIIPVTGLRTQAHKRDGQEHLGNLIVEDSYWRVPDAIDFVCQDRLYWSDSVSSDKDGNVYRIGDSTPVAGNAGTPYGFAQLMGDTWLLSCADKIVYCVNGTVGETVNGKMTYCCSHLDNRLVWTSDDWLYWSTVGVQELSQILSGEALPARLAGLNQAQAMPFPGVTALAPMDDNILVYTSDAILSLRPFAGGRTYAAYPVDGYPANHGLSDRSFFGSDDVHVFIGTDGNVWRIDKDLRATNLGYSWLFEAENED